MSTVRKRQIRALLKSIETGDPDAIAVVDQTRYIQHNPQTHEGSEGLEALFKRLSETSPRVNIVRVFADGDYVFGHTEYDFSTRRIGFEVFRFDGDRAVEHWDNIQPRLGPNPSGHTMVDGPTEAVDLDRTEDNRALVRAFVENVMIARQFDHLADYVDADEFTQHSPTLADGIHALRTALEAVSPEGLGVGDELHYQRLHRVLAEGSFVLTVSEGFRAGAHSSFYDLFRVTNGKLVEHWGTVEKVPPPSEWKNQNGKF
ncbi:MAG: nuclear transport factor 2 family protein [Myxococcota bacterium]